MILWVGPSELKHVQALIGLSMGELWATEPGGEQEETESVGRCILDRLTLLEQENRRG